MTITGFSTALLEPLETNITSPRFSISSIHNVGVHLHDDSGLSGFSYAYVFDPHSSNAIQELIALFAELYVGTEASDMRAVRTKLLTAKANFLGVRGLVPASPPQASGPGSAPRSAPRSPARSPRSSTPRT